MYSCQINTMEDKQSIMLGKFWKKLLKRKGLTDEKTKQDILEYNNTPPLKKNTLHEARRAKKS